MFCYFDIMVGVREGMDRDVGLSPASLAADSAAVSGIPPYLLYPKAFLLVYSDATGRVYPTFFSGETSALLAKLDETITSLAANVPGGIDLVGWELDRVVIPVLAANAVIYGRKLPPRFLRLLNEKWSKTGAYSVERAFWQGWFPNDRTQAYKSDLTLDDAAKLSGLDTPETVRKAMADPNANENPDELELAARLSVVSNIFSRYQEQLLGCKTT